MNTIGHRNFAYSPSGLQRREEARGGGLFRFELSLPQLAAMTCSAERTSNPSPVAGPARMETIADGRRFGLAP